jgi:FHA domain
MSDRELEIVLEVIRQSRTVDRQTFVGKHEIVIGRADECDLQVDFSGVSRRHCALEWEPSTGYVLRDLGSVNGTFVQGRAVSRSSVLRDGGTFTLCEVTIRYRVDAPGPAEGAPQPGRAALHSPELTMRVKSPAARVRGVFPGLRGYLEHLDEPGHLTLLEDSVIVIGSDPSAHLHLTGRGVPRIAALLLRELEQIRCVDASPGGGAVKIDGKHVEDEPLVEDGVLEVAGRRFRFRSGAPRHMDPGSASRQTRRWPGLEPRG